MAYSDYLNKHGGNAVEELLTNMEQIVDLKAPDIWKWIAIRKEAMIFAKSVWKMYKESKKQSN